MARKISINTGFVTNSSSVVYFFPKEVLEDPEVKAFMERYEIGEYVGKDLWYRNRCDSFAFTPEQKAQIKNGLNAGEWQNVSPEYLAMFDNEDEIVLVYGDEYQSLTMELCVIISNAYSRMTEGTANCANRFDYN